MIAEVRILMFVVMSLACLRPCLAQQSPPDDPATDKPAASPSKLVQQAVADLGSPSYLVRERASQRLWNAGIEAQSALDKAISESDDFEVITRARQIVAKFHLGIYPDTPREMVVQIANFRMGSLAVKQRIAQELLSAGKRDLVRRLIGLEPDRWAREQLSRTVPALTDNAGFLGSAGSAPTQADIGLTVRNRLAQHSYASAERLLRDVTDSAGIRDYAALLLARNKLDAEIARVRGKFKPDDRAAQGKLAWFLRAKGDLAGAVAAAKAAKDDNLLEGFLAEKGEWKELAAIDAKTDLNKLVHESAADRQPAGEKLAKIITARNLAGEKLACDEAVAVVIKAIRQQPDFFQSKIIDALFLNDRTDELVKAYARKHLTTAFDILASQNRTKEAFLLVKIDIPLPAKFDWPAWLRNGNAVPDQQRRWLACRVFYALHQIGEDRHADELIEAFLAMLKDHISETDWQFDTSFLVQTDAETSRPDHCDELASKLLSLKLEHPERVIRAMYRNQETAAELLWNGIGKQFPADDKLTSLKRLRHTMAAKPDPKWEEEFRILATRIRAALRSGNAAATDRYNTAEERARDLLALVEICQRHGEPKLSAECLAAIGTIDVSAQMLIERGNLYSDLKQWDEAARSYEAAWAKDARSASALYLLGWSKVKRGSEAEGRKQMEVALMLPLGDGVSRLHLAAALDRLHQDEEALRQRLLIMRLAPPHDESIVMALGHMVDVDDDKPGTANVAAIWQRLATEYILTRAVFMSNSWSESKSQLQWRASAHRSAARELLRAGKTAAAIDEIHRAETIMPEDVQIALGCDADLRKQGAAAEADSLYRRIADRLQSDCRDFPRCAGCRNDLAWLAANLDRDLDLALANAQRAVELAPQSAGILDTLAEVQFRRGNRAQAIQLARRCIELDGDGNLYKERLARFEK